MDNHILRPFDQRVRDCAMEQTAGGGFARLARCPVCSMIQVDEVIAANDIVTHDGEKPKPGYTMRVMQDGQCSRCSTAHARSPEMFEWALAAIAKAQEDAVELSTARNTAAVKDARELGYAAGHVAGRNGN
ncbi:hypothetical protein UFOVP1040_55 [uncultured Caudovirales phage]|uniref:Uncharacterized protein n=1 Tax=uncultured Caudovirales phage TaxID=2100421 RepID=A0A6J5QDL9_9CAUD|nr:hypothetical protein UFOVP1040_55 [uncultured Caudovirales phage]